MVTTVLTQQEVAALFRWISMFSSTLTSAAPLSEAQLSVLAGLVQSVPRAIVIMPVDRIYFQSLQAKIEVAYGSSLYTMTSPQQLQQPQPPPTVGP